VQRIKAEEVSMAEIHVGEVRGGVVVFESEAAPFPEGTKVKIEPVDLESALAGLSTALLDVAGKASGLPPDLAQNHDHYLHGTTKRSQRLP
jgi:hypothetical protein